MGLEIGANGSRAAQDATESGKTQTTGTAGKSARSGGPASPNGGVRSDQLQLSNQAAQLQALEAEIANLPVVDTQRVQEVQHTIATGSFEIMPARVADKMLSFEAGLGKAG